MPTELIRGFESTLYRHSQDPYEPQHERIEQPVVG